MCFENCVLAIGDRISERSVLAKFVFVAQALILPGLILAVFEIPFRLHQSRTAHFLCIPFEQGELMSGYIASISLWCVRIYAIGIFAVNILVNFDLLHDEDKDAGIAGYETLGESTKSVHLWLALLPSLLLSAFAILIAIVMQRYAKNFSLGVRNRNYYWRYMLPFSLLHAVGQCFGQRIYPVLSNAGELGLLIGLSVMTHRVQTDLAVAGSFADFLHRSNVVFRNSGQSEDKAFYSVAKQPRSRSASGNGVEMAAKKPYKTPEKSPREPSAVVAEDDIAREDDVEIALPPDLNSTEDNATEHNDIPDAQSLSKVDNNEASI